MSDRKKTRCAVWNCSNEARSNLSFFCFPKKENELKIWLKFCHRSQRFSANTWRMCMEHFKADDIEGNMAFEMGWRTKRSLRPGAVPCINKNDLPDASMSTTECSEINTRSTDPPTNTYIKYITQDSFNFVEVPSFCNSEGNISNSIIDRNVRTCSSTENWQLWCRLCAKEDLFENFSVLFKDKPTRESVVVEEDVTVNLNLVPSIKKYLSIKITYDSKLPKMLCKECTSLIESLDMFSKRIAKVQEMYQILKEDLKCSKAISTHDLRRKYDLFDDDSEHVLLQNIFSEIYRTTTKTSANGNAGEGCDLDNPLEENHIEEQAENTFNDLEIEDIDEDGECPFENNDDTINNLGEISVDDIKLTTNEAPNSSESVQLKDFNIEEMDEETRYNTIMAILREYTTHTRPRRRYSAVAIADIKDDDKTNSCTKCPRKYKRMQDLRHHMFRVHCITLPLQEISCPHCDRVFKTPHEFRRHEQIHLPDDQKKKYPCSYCDKKFAYNSHVKQHIRHVHMGERPFICDKCGLRLQTSMILKKHMLIHLEYAPFKCEVCNKPFKDKSRLKAHVEIHDPKKHICAKCGLELNSRATLNHHLLVHSNVRKHKCDYCGRTFKRVKNLKAHLLLHTSLKLYSCGFCNRSFTTPSHCRLHKKKQHPTELAALESAGEGKMYQCVPTLETLKTIARTASNLKIVGTKLNGGYQYRQKKTGKNDAETYSNMCREDELNPNRVRYSFIRKLN